MTAVTLTPPDTSDTLDGPSPERAHPLLPVGTIAVCRGESEIQFGISDDVAVTVPLPPGVRAGELLAVLRRLDGATPVGEAVAGAGVASGAEEVVGALLGAGLLERGLPHEEPWGGAHRGGAGAGGAGAALSIHALGRGDLARRIETPLRHAGFRLRGSARAGLGLDLDSPPWRGSSPADLVVLCDDLVPDPLVLAALHRHGTPHLYAACRDGRVVVGPTVIPGTSSCLRCADLYRAERNPAWPSVSAQLLFTSGWAPLPSRVAAVALLLSELLAFRRGGPATMLTLGHTVEISVEEGLWRRRRWGIHERCDCGA